MSEKTGFKPWFPVNGTLLFVIFSLSYSVASVLAEESSIGDGSSVDTEYGVLSALPSLENTVAGEYVDKSGPGSNNGLADKTEASGDGGTDTMEEFILVSPPLGPTSSQIIIQNYMQLYHIWGEPRPCGNIDDCYVHWGLDFTTVDKLSSGGQVDVPLYACCDGYWKGFLAPHPEEYQSRWECTPSGRDNYKIKYIHVGFEQQFASGHRYAGTILHHSEIGDYYNDLRGDHIHVEIYDRYTEAIFNPLVMDCGGGFLPGSDSNVPIKTGGPVWGFEEYGEGTEKGWKIYIDDKIIGVCPYNNSPYQVQMYGHQREWANCFDKRRRTENEGSLYKHTGYYPTFTSDSLPNILNPNSTESVYTQVTQGPHRQFLYCPDEYAADPTQRMEYLLVEDNANNAWLAQYGGWGEGGYSGSSDPTPPEAFGFPVAPPGYEGLLIDEHPARSAAAVCDLDVPAWLAYGDQEITTLEEEGYLYVVNSNGTQRDRKDLTSDPDCAFKGSPAIGDVDSDGP